MSSTEISSTVVKTFDGMDDGFLLFRSELRINRKAQNSFGEPLCHRQIPAPVTQVSRGRLKMNRDGIVDFSFNASIEQESLQFIALLGPDDESMIDRLFVRLIRWTLDDAVQLLAIEGRRSAAFLCPLVEVIELHVQNGGLERIEARIESPEFRFIPIPEAMIAHLRQFIPK